MNFCKDCHMLMYSRYNEDEEQLVSYCKICGNTVPITNFNKTVYKRIYSEDLIAQRYVSNQYNKYDPTLPRINTIKCVNDVCISNSELMEGERFFKTNRGVDELREKLGDKLDATVVHVIPDGATGSLLSCSSDKVDEVKAKLEAGSRSEHVDIVEIPKIQREVMFIKYDAVNMRYMYICSHCNTSWKNT